MSTEQKITAAQLAAARMQFWHQAASPEAPAEAHTPEPATDEAEAASAEGTGPDTPEVEATTDAEQDAGSDDAAEPATEEPAEKAERAPQKRSQALLTTEAARDFIATMGLLLFRPQPALSGGPSASLVEATLGEKRQETTLAEAEVARQLLARLVAEGAAVPLNLTGAPGTSAESPDYVASAAVFPYLFTLRGDKTWKQLPSATGPNKVSPLAVNTYALLAEGEPQTASALTAALGKGLTEAAVLRALGELWQQLRVLPVVQTNGKPTLWEPASVRWTRQMKAGANAGQPTALSALISLYVQQALLATEDEVATFLSPLAARSRVRDVLHGLVAAQELSEVVIDGKHHFHLAGEVPDLQALAPMGRPEPQAAAQFEGEGRIRRMKDARPSRGLDRSRPFAPREGRPDRRGPGGRPDREGRKPFRKDFGPPRDRGSFDRRREGGFGRAAEGSEERRERLARPWEERAPRREWQPPQEGGGSGERRDRAPRAEGDRGGFAPRAEGDRGGFAPRSSRGEGRPSRFGGDRPAFQRKRFEGAEGERSRPWQKPERTGEQPRGDRPFRKPFVRRDESEGGAPFRREGDRPFRKPFAGRDQGEGGAPFRREGDRPFRKPFAGRDEDRPFRKPFARRDEGDGQAPFRRGGDRPDRRSDDAAPRERPFGARSAGGSREEGGQDRPFRRFDAPRPGKKPFGAKPFGGKPGGGKPFGGRPAGGGKSFGERREGRPGGAPGGDRPNRDRPRAESPFAKFVGGAKPWGKRPPKPKVKPLSDEERA